MWLTGRYREQARPPYGSGNQAPIAGNQSLRSSRWSSGWRYHPLRRCDAQCALDHQALQRNRRFHLAIEPCTPTMAPARLATCWQTARNDRNRRDADPHQTPASSLLQSETSLMLAWMSFGKRGNKAFWLAAPASRPTANRLPPVPLPVGSASRLPLPPGTARARAVGWHSCCARRSGRPAGG